MSPGGAWGSQALPAATARYMLTAKGVQQTRVRHKCQGPQICSNYSRAGHSLRTEPEGREGWV